MSAGLNHRWGASPAADLVVAQLSGLSPRLWHGLGLMNLQAYLDESDDGGFFVLGGYVASPEAWIAFSQEWEKRLHFAALNTKNVRRFKMSEMLLNGRMADVPIFYRVIEEHAAFAISMVFKLSHVKNAFARISVPGLAIDWNGWTNPYLLAAVFLSTYYILGVVILPRFLVNTTR